MKDKIPNNGFHTPKDYFDNFEDRLFSKISEDGLPKGSGFNVPEGYFDQLDTKILKSVNDATVQTKVIPLFGKRTLYYTAAIAACAILVFSIVNTNNPVNTINSIEISTIESYIEDGNLDIDSYDIASLLIDEDLNIISSEIEFILENLLEDYLLENIGDSSILIE